MYILIENFNAKKFGINHDANSNHDYQQFELNINNLKDPSYYNDLVKVGKLIMNDEPISDELYLNKANPISINFKLNDGVLISKFYHPNEAKHSWSSKLGYLYNVFEDEDFKPEFLEEVKAVFENDETGYNSFKTAITNK